MNSKGAESMVVFMVGPWVIPWSLSLTTIQSRYGEQSVQDRVLASSGKAMIPDDPQMTLFTGNENCGEVAGASMHAMIKLQSCSHNEKCSDRLEAALEISEHHFEAFLLFRYTVH